ncbi:hypothetical protein Tco_0760684 [Tanacetum coccineum]
MRLCEKLISTPSCDPPQSGEDRLQLTKLMNLCTKLQKQVLDLEGNAKDCQAKEIASLKICGILDFKGLVMKNLHIDIVSLCLIMSSDEGKHLLAKRSSQKKRVKQLEKRKKSRTSGLKRLRKVSSAKGNDLVLVKLKKVYDEEMLFDIQDDLQGEEVVEKEISAVDPITTANKHVEAEKDDDQEEAEMKRHIEIVKDDEVAIDAIPLATNL